MRVIKYRVARRFLRLNSIGRKLLVFCAAIPVNTIASRLSDPQIKWSAALRDTVVLESLAIIGGLTLLYVLGLLADSFLLKPATRKPDAINGILQHLYVSLFGYTSGHRVTLICQPYKDSDYIQPLYRFAYGRSNNFHSKARFAENHALAGIAWAIKGYVHVARIPDYSKDEDGFRKCFREEFNLTEEEISSLSVETQKLRWVCCYGVVHPQTNNFIGVLSIDSIDPATIKRINRRMIKSLGDAIAFIYQATE
jgi:hypothetical protein